MEAIAMEQIPTTLEEKRAALNRERHEAFKQGEQAGEARGEARGRRAALLDMISVVAPDALPRLEIIEDIEVFEREARLAIQQSRS